MHVTYLIKCPYKISTIGTDKSEYGKLQGVFCKNQAAMSALNVQLHIVTNGALTYNYVTMILRFLSW